MEQKVNYVQIVKFAVAGAIGAGIEICMFILLVDFVGMFYLTANIIAISMAVAVNYIISQKWVFDSGRYSKKMEFTVFVVVSLIALMLNQLLMWYFVGTVEMDDKLSKVLAIAIVATFNFFAKKFFVFKG